MTTQMGSLADAVFRHKYAMTRQDGTKETWEEVAARVSNAVCGSHQAVAADVRELIEGRMFLPGGRYLYASGRQYHQVNNCALFTIGDSREEWADLLRRVTHALMTGMGVGVVYSKIRPRGSGVGGLGGQATGPCSVMQMVNEVGRHIKQGGSRRSAIWAGLHWNHPDIWEFIDLKNWPDWMAEAKQKDFNAPATMDGTNVSVILDDHFFHAYHSPSHDDHAHARQVYAKVVRQMCMNGEPGFSVDVGKNAGEHLRNAPVAAGTHVLTVDGYQAVGDIVNKRVTVWTGKQWANTVFKLTNPESKTVKVNMTGGRSIVCDPSHPFILADGSRVAAEHLKSGDWLLVSLPTSSQAVDVFSYMKGFVFGDGSVSHAKEKGSDYEVYVDLTVCHESKKPCVNSFVDVCGFRQGHDSRGYDRYYGTVRSIGETKESFLKEALSSFKSAASFLAGWFDADGSYDPIKNQIRLSGKLDYLIKARRLLESLGIMAGISRAGTSGYTGCQCWLLTVYVGYVNAFVNTIPTIRLQPKQYIPYRPTKIKVLDVVEDVVQPVYCCDVGVEEHSFQAEGVIISNCTEVTSRDDNDICNLGSLNLARFSTLAEFRRAVKAATKFLLLGTTYSDLPLQELKDTRSRNRRLGLGLMGFHEWLLRRGKSYGPDEELGKWLEVYRDESDKTAKSFAATLGVSRPVAVRAIAPTGSIAIIGETTSGIEPIFAVAFKRRYLKGDVWNYQYVIDSAAERLISEGISPASIEDAYTLAKSPEKRLAFQAWVQSYVDQGISSTINLPSWGSPDNNPETVERFASVLMDYLPRLRGITCYPDGSRGGQPISPVSYAEAVASVGVEYQEFGNEVACPGGVCGA